MCTLTSVDRLASRIALHRWIGEPRDLLPLAALKTIFRIDLAALDINLALISEELCSDLFAPKSMLR